MSSPNLAITHVAAAQNQKEVTINDAVDALDLAMTDAVALDFAGGPVTLSTAQFRRAVSFRPAAALAATASLTVPQGRRLFVVINTDVVFAIDVQRGSRVVRVPPATAVTLSTDGTADGLYSAGGAGSGGAARFTELDDTPASYAGEEGRAVVVNAGATALAFADLPGLGALSGRSFFAGATGTFSTASTTAYATKGLVFVPAADLRVTAVLAFVDAAAIGEPHFAQIARLAGAVPTAPVDEVLATSATVASISTDMRGYRFPLAAPVSLSAGSGCLVALSNAAGGGTTALRVLTLSSGSSAAWWLNAPGETVFGAPQFTTVGLAAGQAPATTANGIYGIALEGYLIDHLPTEPVSRFHAGPAAAGAVVLRHVVTRQARLPAGGGVSRVAAGSAAAAPAVFELHHNGTSVGEIAFAAAAHAAVLTVPEAVDLAPGDILAIVVPDPADAGLADLSVSLVLALL